MAEIEIKNLHKSFGDFIAVKNSNLVIENKEFFVLLGPSGCGKTTTLRMIAGLELPTSGNIYLDKEDVSYLRASQRDIAFVFQLFALYPHLNVKNNLAFPLKMQKFSKKDIDT
jgi:multiple sugar transport system ATP-binding protein